jgi:hypothetical protein
MPVGMVPICHRIAGKMKIDVIWTVLLLFEAVLEWV